MTQITFERSGGILGRKVSLRLDLESLPADQSTALQQSLDEADFFNLPENMISSPVPDEFTYTITIQEAAKQHTVRLSDTSATEALRPLLQNLSRRARASRA